MSLDVHRRAPSNATSPEGRPVTRVVLGSLATGLAAAALLTLVVFPGATVGVTAVRRCSASASAG